MVYKLKIEINRHIFVNFHSSPRVSGLLSYGDAQSSPDKRQMSLDLTSQMTGTESQALLCPALHSVIPVSTSDTQSSNTFHTHPSVTPSDALSKSHLATAFLEAGRKAWPWMSTIPWLHTSSLGVDPMAPHLIKMA